MAAQRWLVKLRERYRLKTKPGFPALPNTHTKDRSAAVDLAKYEAAMFYFAARKNRTLCCATLGDADIAHINRYLNLEEERALGYEALECGCTNMVMVSRDLVPGPRPHPHLRDELIVFANDGARLMERPAVHSAAHESREEDKRFPFLRPHGESQGREMRTAVRLGGHVVEVHKDRCHPLPSAASEGPSVERVEIVRILVGGVPLRALVPRDRHRLLEGGPSAGELFDAIAHHATELRSRRALLVLLARRPQIARLGRSGVPEREAG